jgi:hypothetical protein
VPQPVLTLAATTTVAPPNTWPASFTITLWPDRVVLGDKTMPLVNADANSILANDVTGTFTANRLPGGTWQWSFTGIAGQAVGSAVAR